MCPVRSVTYVSGRSAKFPLIRLPLLTSIPGFAPNKARFCAHFAPKFQIQNGYTCAARRLQ